MKSLHLLFLNLYKMLLLFLIGGSIYFLLEEIFRGYSHVSMFILGGLCFIQIGLINEFFSFETSILLQMFIGAVIITLGELVCGIFVNLHLHLNVWDYSSMPLNFLGQICLPFSILWFFLAFIAIILDDYLRHLFWKEEKPHYCLF